MSSFTLRPEDIPPRRSSHGAKKEQEEIEDYLTRAIFASSAYSDSSSEDTEPNRPPKKQPSTTPPPSDEPSSGEADEQQQSDTRRRVAIHTAPRDMRVRTERDTTAVQASVEPDTSSAAHRAAAEHGDDEDPLTRELMAGASGGDEDEAAHANKDTHTDEQVSYRPPPDNIPVEQSAPSSSQANPHVVLVSNEALLHELSQIEGIEARLMTTEERVRHVPLSDTVSDDTAEVDTAVPETTREEQEDEHAASSSEDSTEHNKSKAASSAPPDTVAEKQQRTPRATLAGMHTGKGSAPETVVLSNNSELAARAEEDWFGSRQKAAQDKEGTFEHVVLSRTAPAHQPRRRVWHIAATALIVAAVALGVWAGQDSTLRAQISSYIPGTADREFLSSASFMLVNVEGEETFPQLFTLHDAVTARADTLMQRMSESGAARERLSGELAALETLREDIEVFLTANTEFSWFNPFRGALAARTDIVPYPQNVALLEQIVSAKASYERTHNVTLSPDAETLRSLAAWTIFWHDLFSRDGTYLVVGGDVERQGMFGGEPSTYAVARIENGFVTVRSHGSVAELNAAITAKLIPPEPARAAKTGFDISEAGWFFDARLFDSSIRSLFEQTTGTAVDGVLFVEHEYITALARKQGVLVDPDSDSWFADLAHSLERVSHTQWREFARTLSTALRAHALQFTHANPSRLRSFNDLALARTTAHSADEDVIGIGVRSWESTEGVSIERVDVAPEFFVDGSAVTRTELTFRNSNTEARTVYAHVYLPKESIVVAARGWAAPPRMPAFDYAENSFQPMPEVNDLRTDEFARRFPHLYAFGEKEMVALGGWVQIPSEGAASVSLTYRSPVRLAYQAGRDTYRLRIIPGGWNEAISFVFDPYGEEGVSVETDTPSVNALHTEVFEAHIIYNE